MTHIICYSGGHSSAIAAIEVARRFGTDDLVLLNHDMEEKFKKMRSAGIPLTEHIPHQKFCAGANKIVKINAWQDSVPCECAS